MDNNVSCTEKAISSRCSKPFKKQESHEVQEYGNGCCHVQKKVLLKGFAKIAKSKGCRRRAIKLFVFFICAAGFFYQTWTFLQMYLAYPTTLVTSEEYLDSFMAPAITVCNMNNLLRQPFCKNFPEKCTWQHTTWESFCNKYRRMCPETMPPDFNFGIPEFEYFYGNNASQAARWSHEKSLIVDECFHVRNAEVNGCGPYFNILQIPKNGVHYMCLTIFPLRQDQQEEKPNITTFDDVYHITLDLHPEEYFSTIESVQASVVLHDPRKRVNPMTEGITLTSGNAYKLLPTMERRESLPPPYASNCIDYLKLLKKTGVNEILSKDDCISTCKIRAMLAEYECVGRDVTHPHGHPICRDTRIGVSSEENRLCTSGCRDACEEHSYHLTANTILDLGLRCNATDEHCKSQHLHIVVKFNRMKVKKFKQIPRFESIELFSYIGGYVGLWLGISLASVFDLAEMIYDVIDKAFLKPKKKQKRTTPIEKFPHHTAVKNEKNIVKRRKMSW